MVGSVVVMLDLHVELLTLAISGGGFPPVLLSAGGMPLSCRRSAVHSGSSRPRFAPLTSHRTVNLHTSLASALPGRFEPRRIDLLPRRRRRRGGQPPFAMPLQTRLNKNKPMLFLEDDQVITAKRQLIAGWLRSGLRCEGGPESGWCGQASRLEQFVRAGANVCHRRGAM